MAITPLRLLMPMILGCLIMPSAFAESGRADYDLDDDGLIEINSLADLDEIRNNLDGTGLYGDSTGCPVDGCIGFELTTTLDFDTNADGVMDTNDAYWNEGEGWMPIASSSTPFISIFDGNGHQIRNLYINRSRTRFVGLFGYISGESAQLRNIGLTGELMQVQGYNYVGGLVGYAINAATIEQSYVTGAVSGSSYYVGGLAGQLEASVMSNSYVTGAVTGDDSVGGLVGNLYSSAINNSYVTGAVTGSSYVGGLAGTSYRSSAINNSFASGAVTGNSSVGGLTGYSSSSVITHSYWAVDTTGISSTSLSAATLSELQCPAGANNTSCASGKTLYAEWDSGVWDFGTNAQLPGLILSGTTYRDSDGDGSLDGDDVYPNNRAASWDGDNDGYVDAWTIGCDATCIANSGFTLDHFPASAAAWQDTDLDGYPDAWATGCDATCIANSGLTLDQFPTITAAWQDTDLDGYPDAWAPDCDAACIENSGLILDQFSTFAAAWLDSDLDGNPDAWAKGCDANCQAATGLTLDSYPNDTDNDGINNSDDSDDNNDGITDADADSDGLIDISSLEQLNAIRYNLAGTGRTLVDGGDSDSSGCPATVIDGVMQLVCTGYELTTNLDFDTNVDGVMDANDAYWNDGEGWMPIGSSSVPFTSIFDGNGHQIRNLFINRSDTRFVGLFGIIAGESAQLRNIGLTGELMQVVGNSFVGGLAGYVNSAATIVQSYVTGAVTGDDWYVGGLAGYLSNSAINNSFVTGAVTGDDWYAGGLAGYLSNSSAINNSFATGAVTGNLYVGGLTGYNNGSVITDSYWAVDTTGINSYWVSVPILAELQCPVGADNTSCVADQTLYAEWDSSIWSFGTSSQLPGLIFNGKIYRDSDSDGLLDEDDAFPNSRAASYDSDSDGHPDVWNSFCDRECIAGSGLTLDLFPNNPAAWLDGDLDGFPDSWADTCDVNCQGASGLTLDSYLDDTDNDGINNSDDTDDNNDGITDADADSDGLIEVSTLEQLNAIRYNLTGTGSTLVEGGDSDSSGCPVDVVNGVHQFQCVGYELINNLDFDTNTDGVMDENDAYWDDGAGWEPIASSSTPFTSTFDGNGHQIRNLYINRSSTNDVGLFGYILGESAQLRNIGLTGELMQVQGYNYVGGLVGYAKSAARIDQSYVTGAVSGSSSVGGLAGMSYSNSAINNSFASGAVTGNSSVGGLVGYSSISTINSSFATGAVTGNSSVGGLTGYSNSTVTNSHWATDTTGQLNSDGESEFDNYFGATLVELQCPTSSDNTDDCVISNTLYAGWDSSVWDFGTNTQLPGLILSGATYRDSDGDGSLDGDDAFPNNHAASWDGDNDGHPDMWTIGCDASCISNSGLTLDQFPSNPAVWQDEDLDGYPESWVDGCDANCQTSSGLTLDSYLDDTDNDGINNSDDTDDNNDGITDADADSDGLIDVSSLEQLNAIRYNLAGTGRTLVDGGDSDSSGCPATVIDGVMQLVCIGYELTTNLDFDTNVDGVMDEYDAYWNEGEGWMPIGTDDNTFTSTFDGNGHQIRNLYINRSNTDYIGLFGAISGESAQLRNIGLTGELMQVLGDDYVGGLAGYAKNAARIEQSYVTGAVTGDWYVGGLAGYLDGSVMNNSYVTGAVSGSAYVGGLAGRSYSNSAINNSFASGAVTGDSSVGGLTGSSSSSVITHSYWAVDTTGISSTSLSAATLSELQCPAGADNTSCASGKTLYAEWDSGVWDFGSNTQLPGLMLSGTTYRDSDGDGSLDGDDAYPNNRAASWDSDHDGYADAWTIGCDASCIANSGLTLDHFPATAAAWQDTDLDGYPDAWAAGCDVNCQAATGLTLDSYPHDTDNDGINNSDDSDDNNDGITDADADSDGLIDISSLEQLNAIRYNLAGTGRTLVDGGDSDNSGCPVAVVNGVPQFQCMGYELINNLDFDTNADGVMDANDAYWNEGDGWEPLGSDNFPFGSLFDGNGHEIRNLYVNRPYEDGVGLFGAISGEAVIVSNLGLVGKLSNVLGADGVGLLAGFVGVSAEVSNSYAKGVVTGSYFVGGLVGLLTENASISSSHAAALVSGDVYVGGLVGYLFEGSRISRSFVIGNVSGNDGVGGLVGVADVFASITDTFATGSVAGSSYIGGLVGAAGIEYEGGVVIANSFSSGPVATTDSYGGGLVGGGDADTTVTNSHWATDTTGQLNSDGESEFDNYFGATLAELQCPTSSDNTDDCVISNTLYAGWDSSIWDFGTSTQLPGLIINGIVYRDEDGNGSLDENQAPTVTLTLKQDGYVVSDITAGDGEVTLEATITDPDASDRHTLSWTYDGITVTSETDTGVTFKSDNLVAGEYTVSVVATDNRYSPLSAEAEITFTVYSAYVPEPAPAPGNTSTSSGKKGGGGALGLIWLMLCGGLVYTRQRRVVFAG